MMKTMLSFPSAQKNEVAKRNVLLVAERMFIIIIFLLNSSFRG